MGGSALNFKTKRISKSEFTIISNELLFLFKNYFNVDLILIKSYTNKENFGDMDFLFNVSRVNFDIVNRLKEVFKPKCINSNSDVISFDYKNFQIDLILTKERYLKTSEFYYSYNVFGNLLGKIYHKFGLKFGFYGLRYIIRNPENQHIVKEISISIEPSKILEFIGLDYNVYEKGFDELEDIFRFILSSKYHAKNIYDIKSVRDRKRVEKRSSYMVFLEYLDKVESDKDYIFEKRDNYIPLIQEYFDINLEYLISESNIKIEKINSLKNKLNGKIILDIIPSITGKEIGKLIYLFKEEYDIDDIINMDQETINNNLKKLYITL